MIPTPYCGRTTKAGTTTRCLCCRTARATAVSVRAGSISLAAAVASTAASAARAHRSVPYAETPRARQSGSGQDQSYVWFGRATPALLVPRGPLTYNQQGNSAVFRFYEATGVTVSVSNRQVSVKGGSFGSTPIGAGILDKVISALQASNMSVTLPSALTGAYALTFTAAGGFSPVVAGTRDRLSWPLLMTAACAWMARCTPIPPLIWPTSIC